MHLELTRPIVFFDLETTGTIIKRDRIVQITVIKLSPGGEREVRTRLVNPGMAIPAESTAIHGVTDEMVANEPHFRQLARAFLTFLEGCDLGGYNLIRFDIPVLIEEFKRAGHTFSVEGRKIIDAQRIFFANEPRTLEAALKFYCGEEHEGAHDSEADVVATIKVLEGQLARYTDLPRSVDELDAMYNAKDPSWVDAQGKLKWRDGQVVIGFGQRMGTPLRSLVYDDKSYLQWILRADFEDDVKRIISNAIDGTFPERPKQG
jgi:DNA polymerase-3 subunit epsilon